MLVTIIIVILISGFLGDSPKKGKDVKKKARRLRHLALGKNV